MNKQIKINHAHASIMFHPKWPKRSATTGNLEQNTTKFWSSSLFWFQLNNQNRYVPAGAVCSLYPYRKVKA